MSGDMKSGLPIVYSPHTNHTPLKKSILFTVVCCMFGLFAQAQTVGELTRGEMSAEEEDVDTSVSASFGLPTQKGSSFLGCNILVAQLDAVEFNTDNSMHYRVGASPRYGHFLADNFALGAEINGNIDGYTRIDQYTITAGAGIFARLYTGKAADRHGEVNKFRFFVEGGVGYGYLFDRYTSLTGSGDGSIDYGVLQAHVMPGINYFANRNVAFELGLNYGYQHTVMNEDIMDDDHHSLLLSLGLQFFFCKRN
jgi:hypothetical protein